MNFLQKIAQRLLLILQFVLVFIFILFEEIIWEGIAQPIYEKISSLKILQQIERGVNKVNRYVILTIFTLLLLAVEGAGIFAGVLFVQGYILLGLLLYIIKIPIAAFTFWLFKISRDKLLSFDWFKWLYEKVMSGIAWLKGREIYKESTDFISDTKIKIKELLEKIKSKFFTKESRFSTEIKAFYKYLKNFKNRKKEDKKND